jgi:hypothetical protein
MLSHGQATTILATRVSSQLRHAVKVYCHRHAITMQDMVADAIRRHLGKPIRTSRVRHDTVPTRPRSRRGRRVVSGG